MKAAVVGPSGSGKTSLVAEMVRRLPQLHHSVSCTTRDLREGEIDGVHYHQKSELTFARMIVEKEFAEYADVHGKRYGTLWSELRHPNVILDIDCQGRRRLKQVVPELCTIGVIAPLPVLERRLVDRGETKMDLRLRNAAEEIKQVGEFNFWIENDDFDQAADILFRLLCTIGMGGRLAPGICRNESLLARVQVSFASLSVG